MQTRMPGFGSQKKDGGYMQLSSGWDGRKQDKKKPACPILWDLVLCYEAK